MAIIYPIPEFNLMPGVREATAQAFQCAEKGRVKGLKAALEAGADIRARIETYAGDMSLLHQAMWSEDTAMKREKENEMRIARMLKLLIQYGMHPDTKNGPGRTPVESICEFLETAEQLIPLAALAEEGALLANFGWDVDENELHQFVAGTHALWLKVADRLRSPAWSELTLKDRAHAVFLEALEEAKQIQEDEARNRAIYFWLSAIRVTSAETAFEQLNEHQAEPWLKQAAEEALNWLTPARIIRHLASVMPASELFSPDRWRGHEEEALRALAKQRPWLREEAGLLLPALENGKARAISPLSGWRRQASGALGH